MVLVLVAESKEIAKALSEKRLLKPRVIFPDRTSLLPSHLPGASRACSPAGVIHNRIDDRVQHPRGRGNAKVVKTKGAALAAILIGNQKVFDKRSHLDHAGRVLSLIPRLYELAVVRGHEKDLVRSSFAANRVRQLPHNDAVAIS